MTGPGELEAAFKGLPAALQALQDRAVAEAVRQAEAQLDRHYALYHRGGGGGALALVETQTMADSTVDTVDFETIPEDGAALLLVISATVNAPGFMAAAEYLLLRINDDSTTHYWPKYHFVYGGPSAGTAHLTQGSDATHLPLGPLGYTQSAYDAAFDPVDEARGSIVAWFPGHGDAGRRKQVLSSGSAYTGPYSGAPAHHLGQYGGEWRGTGAITKLTLYPAARPNGEFAAGSRFSLYRLAE